MANSIAHKERGLWDKGDGGLMIRSFSVEKSHTKFISKSTLFKVLSYLDKKRVETPFVLIDTEKIKEKISLIGKNIRNSKVFYALKANPDIAIASLVRRQNIGFEIASEGELKILSSLKVDPETIISSNPVKSISFLEVAAHYGVRYFSYDSNDELEKIANYAPRSNVYVRLSVPNEGSDWPLSKKFGVELDDAVRLLSWAQHRELTPVGVTFHVGSQCTKPYNWNIAIDKAKILWDMAAGEGIKLSVLNIGGGYPINYTKTTISIEEIETNINKLVLEKFPEDVAVHIEPGRSIVGDAGVLVSTVIGKARRYDEDWLYIDVGVFNGLLESIGGIKYSYIVENNASKDKRWTIAGPSCDSFDVIDRNITIPEPDIGSLVLILSSGAYTVSYASEFNGFSRPKNILI
jgi:ornithine decarboxylase